MWEKKCHEHTSKLGLCPIFKIEICDFLSRDFLTCDFLSYQNCDFLSRDILICDFLSYQNCDFLSRDFLSCDFLFVYLILISTDIHSDKARKRS